MMRMIATTINNSISENPRELFFITSSFVALREYVNSIGFRALFLPSEIFGGFFLEDKDCLIRLLQTSWGGAFVPGEKKGAPCPILSKRRDRMCHHWLRTFALKATAAIHGFHGLRARTPLRDGGRKCVPKAI
jgi:hypothetical protein